MARRSRRKIARHPKTFEPTVYHTGVMEVSPYEGQYGNPLLAALAFEGAKHEFYAAIGKWWWVGLAGVGGYLYWRQRKK